MDSSFIFLFVDFNRYRVWIWQGANTTTRIKFISAKRALNIRDRYGTTFRITTVDEGNEPVGFKVIDLIIKFLYERKNYDFGCFDFTLFKKFDIEENQYIPFLIEDKVLGARQKK